MEQSESKKDIEGIIEEEEGMKVAASVTDGLFRSRCIVGANLTAARSVSLLETLPDIKPRYLPIICSPNFVLRFLQLSRCS